MGVDNGIYGKERLARVADPGPADNYAIIEAGEKGAVTAAEEAAPPERTWGRRRTCASLEVRVCAVLCLLFVALVLGLGVGAGTSAGGAVNTGSKALDGVPANRDRPYSWIDATLRSGGDMDLCQGDCATDADCQPGLRCFVRNGDGPVPNCNGNPRFGVDYCVLAEDWEAEYKLEWEPNYPPRPRERPYSWIDDTERNSNNLDLCQGDCETDADCEPGLRCFLRAGHGPVPNCNGSPRFGVDYCVLAYNWEADYKLDWVPNDPASYSPRIRPRDRPYSWIDATLRSGGDMDLCQGDCATDADCQPGLRCFVRNGDGPVPNCNGNPRFGVDYCVLAEDWEAEYKLEWAPRTP